MSDEDRDIDPEAVLDEESSLLTDDLLGDLGDDDLLGDMVNSEEEE